MHPTEYMENTTTPDGMLTTAHSTIDGMNRVVEMIHFPAVYLDVTSFSIDATTPTFGVGRFTQIIFGRATQYDFEGRW